MDISRQGIERTLRDLWTTVASSFEAGTTAVRDSIGGLPFLASVAASTQHDDVARDETHIFLVPTPFAADGYAVYTARRLPEGATAANDLPKLRVFHLPGVGADERLIELVLANAVDPATGTDSTERMAGKTPASATGMVSEPVADRLHRVAAEIERHERKVTGGILLIGGAVAVANPLLGVGIAAKAILPSLGGMLSREGLKLAGDKLRTWSQQRENAAAEAARQEAEAKARKEFAATPTVSFVNPMLEHLETALRTDGTEFDPTTEFYIHLPEAEGWNQEELIQLTAQAIVQTLGAADGPAVAAGLAFGPEDRRWLEDLRRRSTPPLEPGR